MKDGFNDAGSGLCEAEQVLNSWGIKFENRPDGTLFVPGSIDISKKSLTQLPDLSRVVVNGGFNCNHNGLTSLKGSPQTVGSFYCSGNHLTSLEYGPQTVAESFYCPYNNLATLKGAPARCLEFWCHKNPALESLEHAPETGKCLQSDFGTFRTLADAPDHIKKSAETRRFELEQNVVNATILQASTKIRAPLKLVLR